MRIRHALHIVLLAPLLTTAPALEFSFPADFFATDSGGAPVQVGEVGCVNVKAYGAVGDGVADDTAAINAALIGTRSQSGRAADYYSPRPRMVWFPAGTYKVTNTLTWVGINLTVRGAGRGDTIIRLANSTTGFTDAAAPKPVLKCWRSQNYGFAHHISDLTVDTGTGNAGAIGIEYNANNTGSLRNVRVTGGGVRGIDMTPAWPGPCLVKDVLVEGFQVGIDVAGPEYGPTFENITLSGQSVAGFRNGDNPVAIRNLVSTNSVPAVQCTGGRSHCILIGATCGGGSGTRSAVELPNGGIAYLRNVSATGYQSALKENTTVVAGMSISERVTGPVKTLFNTDAATRLALKLPISETPTYHDNTLSHWVRLVGGSSNGDITSGQLAGNQARFDDATKTTVWVRTSATLAGVPTGTPIDQAGFRVPTHIRRFIGFGTNFNKYNGSVPYGLVLRVQDATATPLVIDECRGAVHVYHACSRPVVLRHGQYRYVAAPGAGPLYLEDVGSSNITTIPGQKVWARQLNIEGTQLHVDNDGGDVWILGLKTEFGGTVARTRNGGRTEFLGTLLYPLSSRSNPAFESVDGNISLSYVTSNYAGDYATQVSETRQGETRTLPTGAAGNRFEMPLFVGWTGDGAAIAATGTLSGSTLAIAARTDGAAGAVTWTSQPAGVTFSPPTVASTTATFPGPGRYVLTVTYGDGSTGSLVVTVPAPAAASGGGGGGGGGCGGGVFGLLMAACLALGLRGRR